MTYPEDDEFDCDGLTPLIWLCRTLAILPLLLLAGIFACVIILMSPQIVVIIVRAMAQIIRL